jgi:hypothetical protein
MLEPMAWAPRRFWVVLLCALTLYAAGTHTRVFAAGNDASRWAHIESLVDYERPTLELSRFRQTVDRVLLDGHELSNKPPLLALLGAGLYAPLRAATGWRLGDPASAARLFWILTVLLVGFPAAATVAVVDRVLGRCGSLPPRWRTVTTAALGLGTLLLSFSGTLNNHVPAALFVLIAVIAALDGRGLEAGVAVGLAAGIDLLPGLGFAPVVAMMLVTHPAGPRQALPRFVIGGSAAAVIVIAANFATTGTPLPPKLVPGAVDLAAQAGPSAAGVVLPQSWAYPWELLLGGHGLFSVSPVLLLGAVGLASAVRRPPFGNRAFWALLALGVVVQFAGHALLAGSYGGWSYGYRYLLPVQPLLALAIPTVLVGRNPGLARAVLLTLLPASVLFAALGAYHPWPPAFEQATAGGPVATLVTNPIGGNAAAWAADHLPEGRLVEGLGARFISPDPEMRRRYLWLFFASKGDLEGMAQFADPPAHAEAGANGT